MIMLFWWRLLWKIKRNINATTSNRLVKLLAVSNMTDMQINVTKNFDFFREYIIPNELIRALVVDESKVIPLIASPVPIKYFWCIPWYRYGFTAPVSTIIKARFRNEKIALVIKKRSKVLWIMGAEAVSTISFIWCTARMQSTQKAIPVSITTL